MTSNNPSMLARDGVYETGDGAQKILASTGAGTTASPLVPTVGSVATLPVSAAGGINGFYHLVSAASINANVIKNSAARVMSLRASNSSASWRYLKIYNKGSAIPVPGTDAPIDTIGIPPGGTVGYGSDIGYTLSNGFGVAITGAPADGDATAINANEVVISAKYV